MDGSEVVVPRVDQIRVFVNDQGDVVLAQLNSNTGEESIVWMRPEHIGAVCKALRLAAKEAADA